MASIFKTDAGTYRDKVSIPVNGKYKQKTKSGFKNKTEAKAWATQIEAHKFEENKPKYSNDTVQEYFDRWVSIYKVDLAPATLYQYKVTSNVIKRYIGSTKLIDFNRQEFQKFINTFGIDHAKETVTKRRVHIAQALRDAYSEGIIERDPTIRIKTIGLDGKSEELKFLELDQLKKIENYSFQNLNTSDAFLAMFIAIHTGMRFGEIAALRLNNVNFEQKTIIIEKSMDMFHNEREPKTKSSIRTIRVDEKLLSVLKNLRLNQTELIIKSNNQLVGRYLRDTIKELNIKQVTFHALRHSHASYLISRGVAIQYVSERLGHADVSITQQVYSHLLNSLRVKEESKAISLLDNI